MSCGCCFARSANWSAAVFLTNGVDPVSNIVTNLSNRDMVLAGPGAVWALMLEVLQNACRDRFPSRDAPPPSSSKCKTGETFLFIFLLSAGEQPRLRCLSRFCPNCACQRAGGEDREKRASVHQRKASRVSYMNFTTGAQESGEILLEA